VVDLDRERAVTGLESWPESRPDGVGWPFAGAAIGTLRHLLDHGRGETGLGRLGGFVSPRSARDWSGPLGLTCHHVLAAGGARLGDTVYQPQIVDGPDGAVLPATALNPIGTIADPGLAGPHRYAHPGDDARDFYVDCATVRLSAPGLRHSGPAAILGCARPHQSDLRQGRGLPVRLLGVQDRPTGRIVDVAATVAHADGQPCPNSLVIETLPGHTPFATRGESGALVADVHDRAVGILWGVDLEEPRRAFACHLLPALDALGLVLLRASRRTPLGGRA
jgi:hypothetical protein